VSVVSFASCAHKNSLSPSLPPLPPSLPTCALTVPLSSSSSGASLSILFCWAARAAAERCFISASFCRMASSDRTRYLLQVGREGGREGGRVGESREAADNCFISASF